MNPRVHEREGKLGRVTLLIKDPTRLTKEANLKGIPISLYIFKLEPVAFYAQTS